MSVIEGFGDEVTIVAALMLIVILLISVLYVRRVSFEDFFNIPWLRERLVSEQQTSSEPNESSLTETNESHASGSEDVSEAHCSIGEKNSSQQHSTASDKEDTPSTNLQKDPIIVDTNTGENSIHSHEVRTLSINHISDVKIVEGAAETVAACTEIETSLEGIEPSLGSTIYEAAAEPILEVDEIRLRIKYLNDTEKTVITKLTESIADFKRTHFFEEVSNDKVVRLIYNGQLLRNERTLGACGICDGCVIHVHISQVPTHQAPPVNTNADLDLSHLLWPLFSVILGICWVMYFKYPEFFNVTSIIILLALTASFLIIYAHTQMQHS